MPNKLFESSETITGVPLAGDLLAIFRGTEPETKRWDGIVAELQPDPVARASVAQTIADLTAHEADPSAHHSPARLTFDSTTRELAITNDGTGDEHLTLPVGGMGVTSFGGLTGQIEAAQIPDALRNHALWSNGSLVEAAPTEVDFRDGLIAATSGSGVRITTDALHVRDLVSGLIQDGTGITWAYDGPSGTLTPTVSAGHDGVATGIAHDFDSATRVLRTEITRSAGLSTLAGEISIPGGTGADGVINSLVAALDTGSDVLTIHAGRTIGSGVVATVDLSSLGVRGDTFFVQDGTPDDSVGQEGDFTFSIATGYWYQKVPSGVWAFKYQTSFDHIFGTAETSQIPNLNASWITAGIFDAARIPGGARGNAIFVQSLVPNNAVGEDGDYAFAAFTGIWFVKSGGTWTELFTYSFDAIGGVALDGQIPDLDASKTRSGIFDDARIPDLHASKITSGVFADARIPAEITRDTELAATTGDLGLAVDMTGNVYFRRDGTGADSIHLSASGGGYAYVDRTLSGASFDSALGQIRFGGGDNSDRAGWYLAIRAQDNQERGQIPADVSNENWIRIDNDIYPNIGGGQTTRLTSLLFRHPTPADALSTIYTIDPVATDAEAVDDQGASSGNPYIYTPFQLASVVTAHQSPTHNLPHLAMLPTPNVGDLALLDHDYTQGNRRDAEVTFNTLGASFHGWSDGSVFGRSGTTNHNLSPLQFIRLQYNGSVYTASQLGSTNRSWIDRLDKYVSNNTEYDLGPTTTQGGHFVRAIVGGPNNANIATPVDINLKFTDGAYWLTDGTVIIWPRGEYLWNNDTNAYEHYDGWLGLTVRDHSANAFSGIKELRLHQSLKDFSIPGDPESLGLEISTAWLQPKIAERVKEYARLGSTSRVPLSDTYADSVVGGTFDETARLLTLPQAGGGSFTISIPAGGGGGGGGDDAFDWATVGNTDIIPGPKLPSDLENVDNSDITYTDATVSSFASRVAQLTTRTGVDSTQGDSYQFQWVDSDTTADKRIAIQVNGGVIRTVVFQDGAGLRRVNLGDLARYNIIQIYRGSGSFHFTGGTREAGGGGNPDAFVGVSRANLAVTFTQADGTTEILTLPAGGGGGGLTEAEVDARVVAGTLAEARAGDTGRWGAAKMFGDTLVGVQVSGNALTLTDARGGTAGRNLPNAVTGGALTLVGQQLSLTAYRHTGGAISLGSVTLPAGGGGGDDAFDWATVGNTDRAPIEKMYQSAVTGAAYDYVADRWTFTFADGAVGLYNQNPRVTANPGGTGLTDLTTIEIDGTDYAISGGGGGGTTVVANPGGGGLTALTSITIGSADYAITGGGGGDAFDWATEGNTDQMPRQKAVANSVLGLTLVGSVLHFEYADSGAARSITLPGGGLDLGTATELTVLDNADRVLVADQSDSWANKYMTAENYAEILRPEVYHGLVRIASGPSSLNFDSDHFTVSGSNSGADIQLANVGVVDIEGLVSLTGTLAGGDEFVIYNDSANSNQRVSLTAIGVYASRISGFITTTETPADTDYFYFGDLSDSSNMKRVAGSDLKTYIGAGGGGDDAYDWATEGNDAIRMPLSKAPVDVIASVSTPFYEGLSFHKAGGSVDHFTINTPAAGSVTEAMLAMHNTPANGQVVGWDLNNARMEWLSVATDQHVIDLINAYNPTAIPGAVTQTGGGDRGSGPRRAWEDHTHQIVGIQLDDIPGTPITTVPDDALLLVETSGGINRKITGANARTSLGGGGGDSAQTDENTRVVEHILDRLGDFSDRVSDIDETSVSSTQAFSTATSMKLVASQPTNADRGGTFSTSLTNLTIGPNETGYVIFRIGIDERPNLWEPQLYTSGGSLIQNLSALGFSTELSETSAYRYFYLPRHFPVEDTGTLWMRVTTRTAHTTWLGAVAGSIRTTLFDGSHHFFVSTYQMLGTEHIVCPATGTLEISMRMTDGSRVGFANGVVIPAAWLYDNSKEEGDGISEDDSDASGFSLGGNRWMGFTTETTSHDIMLAVPGNLLEGGSADADIRIVHVE